MIDSVESIELAEFHTNANRYGVVHRLDAISISNQIKWSMFIDFLLFT